MRLSVGWSHNAEEAKQCFLTNIASNIEVNSTKFHLIRQYQDQFTSQPEKNGDEVFPLDERFIKWYQLEHNAIDIQKSMWSIHSVEFFDQSKMQNLQIFDEHFV